MGMVTVLECKRTDGLWCYVEAWHDLKDAKSLKYPHGLEAKMRMDVIFKDGTVETVAYSTSPVGKDLIDLQINLVNDTLTGAIRGYRIVGPMVVCEVTNQRQYY